MSFLGKSGRVRSSRTGRGGRKRVPSSWSYLGQTSLLFGHNVASAGSCPVLAAEPCPGCRPCQRHRAPQGAGAAELPQGAAGGRLQGGQLRPGLWHRLHQSPPTGNHPFKPSAAQGSCHELGIVWDSVSHRATGTGFPQKLRCYKSPSGLGGNIFVFASNSGHENWPQLLQTVPGSVLNTPISRV